MDPDLHALLLQQARGGDRAALGQLLEEFRPYLVLLARRRFDPRLQSRVDPADLVQHSFLEAYRDLGTFRGQTVGEFAAWLRTLLERNALEVAERHFDAQRRSLHREAQGASPSTKQQALAKVPIDQSTPSQRAMRGEDAVRLASALGELPEDQAEAIRLRHLEGLTLKQMATQLQRSETAVAGLVKRGLRKLKDILAAG